MRYRNRTIKNNATKKAWSGIQEKETSEYESGRLKGSWRFAFALKFPQS